MRLCENDNVWHDINVGMHTISHTTKNKIKKNSYCGDPTCDFNVFAFSAVKWSDTLTVGFPLTCHSVMKRVTSSFRDAVLFLLNSSFTYWSPRARRSMGRKRCSNRILLYNDRTADTCAECAITSQSDSQL